jgi:hypothetical protein
MRATKDAPQPAAGAARPVWPDEGPRTWAPRPTRPEITADDLRTRLYGFADDSMLGRRAGEPGNVKGTEYIAREFGRLGLKPAGDGGTFFQTLPFGPGRFDSTASRLVIAGAPLAGRTDWIPTTPSPTNMMAGAIDVSNVPTVFAGQWGDTTVTLDPAAFRGKVAVFLPVPPAPGAAPAGRGARTLRCDSVPDRFGADAAIRIEAAARAAAAARGARPVVTTAVARDARAQAAGAVGVLVAGLDNIAVATANAAFNTRMGMQPATPAGAIAGAQISQAAAERLFGKPLDQLQVGATGQPVTARWRYDWRATTAPARNVIAVLPGSTRRAPASTCS